MHNLRRRIFILVVFLSLLAAGNAAFAARKSLQAPVLFQDLWTHAKSIMPTRRKRTTIIRMLLWTKIAEGNEFGKMYGGRMMLFIDAPRPLQNRIELPCVYAAFFKRYALRCPLPI